MNGDEQKDRLKDGPGSDTACEFSFKYKVGTQSRAYTVGTVHDFSFDNSSVNLRA